ncbi:hypothetical protein [Companilactobacillus mishanensis]|uniref:hypothetical protein n=1 Tax=Companilactobacillus mishanensis TaxID=2486008 RepID=UPI0012972D2E|nr:hypothetical protein [Companilactobacillus mishanensis]MQS90294.1 hypothetical protein [Companilactobacillus mishanensis]
MQLSRAATKEKMEIDKAISDYFEKLTKKDHGDIKKSRTVMKAICFTKDSYVDYLLHETRIYDPNSRYKSIYELIKNSEIQYINPDSTLMDSNALLISYSEGDDSTFNIFDIHGKKTSAEKRVLNDLGLSKYASDPDHVPETLETESDRIANEMNKNILSDSPLKPWTARDDIERIENLISKNLGEFNAKYYDKAMEWEFYDHTYTYISAMTKDEYVQSIRDFEQQFDDEMGEPYEDYLDSGFSSFVDPGFVQPTDVVINYGVTAYQYSFILSNPWKIDATHVNPDTYENLILLWYMQLLDYVDKTKEPK